MKHLRLLILISTIFLLNACTSTNPGNVPASARGKSVVVISTYENKMQIMHIGTTAFQNNRTQSDTSSWQINDDIEAYASSVINDSKQFNAFPSNSIELRTALKDVGSDYSHTKMWEIDLRKKKIQDAARAAEKELVMLIRPNRIGDNYFKTNQILDGYGIYQRSAYNTENAIYFATMEVVLYDGATGNEITWKYENTSLPRSHSVWMNETLIQTTEDATQTRASITKMLHMLGKQLITKVTQF